MSEQLNGATFNRELGEVVEQGSIQVFDCPPLLYSPPSLENTEHLQKKHFDLPTTWVRTHEQDSILGMPGEINTLKKPNILF